MSTFRRFLSGICLAVLATFVAAVSPAAGQTGTDHLVSSAPVEEYFITCNPDDFAFIYANYSEDIYIPVTVTHRDRTWTDVQMRLRGDSSRELPKKSLKFKSGKAPFANGRDVLNFNAEYLDNSYLYSMLASRLFAEAGYPCFTAEPVRVYLNGTFIGLYISIENMDEAFLSAHGLDPAGTLYKATYDGACLSAYEDVYTLWEKKTNENTGRQDLQQLIHELNTTSDADYYNVVQRIFDYDRMVTIIAMNILIANGSTYYHNYYMYRNPADGKWTMIPWDLDRTFTAYGLVYPYQRSTSWHHDNPFLERALMCPPIFADIQQRLDELASTIFTSAFLDPRIDEYKERLAATIAEDTSDLNTSVEQWHEQLGRIKSYISDRYRAVQVQIASSPRTFRIRPTSGVLTPPVALSWHTAVDPDSQSLTYTVRISTEQHFPPEKTLVYNNLADTVLTLPELPEERLYYWTVAATDGSSSTDGFDKLNSFVYRRGSALPSPVQGTVTLTEAGSPYLADGDLVVSTGSVLRAEPGVELRLGAGGSMIVYGGVELTGSDTAPIHITGRNTSAWNGIRFADGSLASVLDHVTLDLGTTAHDGQAALAADNSDITLRAVHFARCPAGVAVRNSRLLMENCRFPEWAAGTPVTVHGGTVEIAGCRLDARELPVPVAFALDSVDEATIHANYISGVAGAGIGLHRSTAALSANTIAECSTGIVADAASQLTTVHDIIAGVDTGIAVLGGSSAHLDRTTLYAAREGCRTAGAAGTVLLNSIISQAATPVVAADGGTITVRYSLSDTQPLPGEYTLHGNPLFTDADGGDFSLRAGSPCIDAGDPLTATDPDGTRADIGARYFRKTAALRPVVINEIAYNPASEYDTGDWVELYNPNDEPVDVAGWIFRDEDDSHTFTFPAGTLIGPRGYLVLCTDTVQFRLYFPDVHPVIGNTGFGLAGGGELVRLYDRDGAIVDSLTYDDNAPWPTEPDGDGPTVELIDDELDNAFGQSWKASKETNGTPGARNSTSVSAVQDKDKASLFFLYQNRPNPFADQTTIDYVLLRPAVVSVEVFDAVGKPVRTLYTGYRQSGNFTAVFDASGLPPGQYLYGLRIDGELVTVKSAVVVK